MRKPKKPRKYRALIRAARLLEAEAREYIEDAKSDGATEDDCKVYGHRAADLISAARAVRRIASTGYIP